MPGASVTLLSGGVVVLNFVQAESSESGCWLIIHNRKMYGQSIVGNGV